MEDRRGKPRTPLHSNIFKLIQGGNVVINAIINFTF